MDTITTDTTYQRSDNYSGTLTVKISSQMKKITITNRYEEKFSLVIVKKIFLVNQ